MVKRKIRHASLINYYVHLQFPSFLSESESVRTLFHLGQIPVKTTGHFVIISPLNQIQQTLNNTVICTILKREKVLIVLFQCRPHVAEQNESLCQNKGWCRFLFSVRVSVTLPGKSIHISSTCEYRNIFRYDIYTKLDQCVFAGRY